MKYNKLGRTDLLVSEIGFGVLTVGHNQLDLPVDKGSEVLKYALKNGINFLDTAEYYETYPYIKKALDDLKAENSDIKPIICSKSLGSTRSDMTNAINNGLQELGIDYFDIFLMHEVRHNDSIEMRRGAFEALKEAQESGKVKYIGISTHHVDVAKEAAMIDELDVLFPLINLEGLGIRDGANAGAKEDMEDAIALNSKMGKGVFLMKIFGGGNLVSRYQEALNYGKSVKGSSSMMIGFGSTEEVDKAVSFSDGTLPSDYAPNLTNKKITIDQGDCEMCMSCIKKCPNNAIYIDDGGGLNVNHDNCLTCGYCAPVCPTRALIFIG